MHDVDAPESSVIEIAVRPSDAEICSAVRCGATGGAGDGAATGESDGSAGVQREKGTYG